MTFEEIRQKKEEGGYTCKDISDISRIPPDILQNIFDGASPAPESQVLDILEYALDVLSEDSCRTAPAPSFVRESPAPYGSSHPQGRYTLRDYDNLPSERQAELIDGTLYDMGAPSTIHQLLCSELSSMLYNYIHRQNGRCTVLQSPVDVQLDCDSYTMLQPDVFVICDRDKFLPSHIYGAPDFIIEILSPSTRKKDMGLKLQKYMNAGVREYWMIDPEKKKIIVYDLEHEEFPAIYSFDDSIPVMIFQGDCRIDFHKIYENICFLYE